MLNIDATYCNFIDFLVINSNSSEEAKSFKWSKSECEKIISLSQHIQPSDGEIVNAKIDYKMRKVTQYRIPNDNNNNWIYEKVARTIINANNFFWNYDIDFVETIELLKYSYDSNAPVQDHYDKHSDFGPNLPKRKISYSATLSDPSEYDGGDLVFFLENDMTMPKEQGQVVLFPSFQFHSVTSVTRGTRWSLVTWCSGRPLK